MAKKKNPKVKVAPYKGTPKLQFGRKVKKEITPERFKQLEDAVRAAWQHDYQSAKDFGWRLLELRDAFYKRGDLTKWLRANSVEQNRASYCMRLAQGHAKKAQEKQKDLPQNKLKKHLTEIFAPAEKLPDNVTKQLAALIMDCCDKLAENGGWTKKANVANTAEVASNTTAKLQAAINEVLDSVFIWEQIREADNDVVMRVPPPTGRAAAEKTFMAAAASGGFTKPSNSPSFHVPPPVKRQDK